LRNLCVDEGQSDSISLYNFMFAEGNEMNN